MSDNPTNKQKEAPKGALPVEDPATNVTLEDSDVLDCAIGFYLPALLNYKNTQSNQQNKAIHHVGGDNLVSFENYFTDRDYTSDKATFISEKDFYRELKKNTLFLNSVFPKITLYKTFFETDDKGSIIRQTDIPFNLETNWSIDNVKEKYKTRAGGFTIGTIDKILKKGGPGGVGITSFEWQSQGKNEGNLTLYKAKIKLVLETIEEMTKVRGQFRKKSICLLDLLYPGAAEADANSIDRYSPRDNIIRAVVGWNIPTEYQNSKNYFQTALTLNMYDHTFNFSDNGKIELEVSFVAGIESMMYDKNKYNVLANNETSIILKDISTLQEIVFDSSDKMSTAITPTKQVMGVTLPSSLSNIATEEFKKDNRFAAASILNRPARDSLIAKLQERLRENNRSALIAIIEKLVANKKIYSINLDDKYFELLRAFVSVTNMTEEKWRQFSSKLADSPPTVSTPSVDPGAIANLFKGGYYRQLTNGEQVFNTDEITGEINGDAWYNLWNAFDGTRKVPFIYLGDLLGELISSIFPENNQIDLFFSPFTYIDYQQSLKTNFNNIHQSSNENGSAVKRINTALLKRGAGKMTDIPISISSLFSWYEERIVSREEKALSFGAFLDNVFYYLIPMSVGSTQAPNAPKQNIVVNRKYFSTKEKITTSPIIGIADLAKKYNLNNDSDISGNNKAFLNFYFGAIKQHNTANLRGDVAEDTKRKIFHLYTNVTNGFVKNIKFKRPDNPLLVTDNLLSSMDASNNEYIRHPYNATITMFGNNFFEPGSLVYIVPNYVGTNLKNNTFFKIGLGGYYRISQINSSIGLGGYETVLEATWETWPK